MSFAVHGCLCPENRPTGAGGGNGPPAPPANLEDGNRDDDTPHRARHPIQRSSSKAHQLGGHARGDQAGRDFLDLDRPHRRPAARHSARRRLARRRAALLHGPGRAEGAQPRRQPARCADHGRQRLAERPRRGCRGRGGHVTDAQQLDRLAAAWAQKWDGRWQYEVSQDGFRHDVGTALVFAVRPAKVLAFTKGGFSHTRHRF